MGCNCKAVKTINNIKELYGDNENSRKNINLQTILLRIFILIVVIILIPFFLLWVVFAKPFKGPIDIKKLFNLKHV